MSEVCKTVRVKSTDPKSQGPFVEINESDYNEKVHGPVLDYKPDTPPPAATVGETPPPADGLNFASTAARDKAIASGLDFSKVKGTSKKGEITIADVDAAIAKDEAEKLRAKTNFASDEAGEMAVDLGLTAEQIGEIVGTGEGGAITVEDVSKYAESLTE